MQKFPAILIDDDEHIRSDWMKAMKDIPNMHPVACGDSNDAGVKDDTIYELLFGFYLIAFIDLKIGKDENAGYDYAQFLSEHQPLCERILRSRVFGTAKCPTTADKLQDAFHPNAPIFNSFMAKGHLDLIKEVVEDRCNRFGFTNKLDVSPKVSIESEKYESKLTIWTESIVKKILYPTEKKNTLSSVFKVNDHTKATTILFNSLKMECDFLISSVCGQGLHQNQECPVDRISLSLLEEGKSTSLVLMGQPVIKENPSGVWLVFKIDLKDRILTELHGFDNYVKFRVARGRRVEVLGHAVGNRLGTICYTFVGENPEKPITLKTFLNQELSDQNSGGVKKVAKFIEKLFSKPDLHKVSDSAHDIRDFSKKRFCNSNTGFNLDDTWSVICKDIQQLFEKNRIDFEIPVDVTMAETLGSYLPSCWSHGDLHLSNIVLGNDGDLILIDFRDTGPAPQVWDFMTLATSVRLEASIYLADDYSVSKIQNFFLDEMNLLNSISKGSRKPIRLSSTSASDFRVLLRCVIQWMKMTFIDSDLQSLRRQFIACSFAWSCYIYGKIKKEIDLLGFDQDENSSKLQKKQIYLALYLCFLAKSMVDDNK